MFIRKGDPAGSTRRDDPLQKTGYRIPQSLVMRVREAVEAGEARSQNEFVERALRRELAALHEQRLHEEYERAAGDPEFMRDVEEVRATFDEAVADGLGDADS